MTIAGFIGIEFPKVHKLLNSAIYQRGELEDYLTSVIGQKNISQAVSDETLVVAYDYNS